MSKALIIGTLLIAAGGMTAIAGTMFYTLEKEAAPVEREAVSMYNEAMQHDDGFIYLPGFTEQYRLESRLYDQTAAQAIQQSSAEARAHAVSIGKDFGA